MPMGRVASASAQHITARRMAGTLPGRPGGAARRGYVVLPVKSFAGLFLFYRFVIFHGLFLVFSPGAW